MDLPNSRLQWNYLMGGTTNYKKAKFKDSTGPYFGTVEQPEIGTFVPQLVKSFKFCF